MIKQFSLKHLMSGLFAGLFIFSAAPVSSQEKSKSVALIIDASGSMRSKLPSGQRRIKAAKAAVSKLVGKLPGDMRLALRAYGHQSPTKAKNCKDTQLLTSFQPINGNRQDIIKQTQGLKAQGYTPISLVLELAAKDLKASEMSAGARSVILVSDGKETCKGDPCAVAKALAAADTSLVIHTIGFAVDVAARYQLQCIARVARGKYFEADSTDKLAEHMSQAVKTVAITIPKAIPTKSTKPGSLRLKNTTGSHHDIISVKTGKKVGSLSAVTSSVTLPAGFYNVKFGNSLWRSIEVKNGEATVIETAIIELPNASWRGHKIFDAETREKVDELSSRKRSTNVLPSSFVLTLGKQELAMTLKPGERRVVKAVSVSFKGLGIHTQYIFDETGKEVASVSGTGSSATLLPGKYILQIRNKYKPEIPTQRIPFELKAGTKLKMKLK